MAHFVNSAARAAFEAMSIEDLKAYIAKTEINGHKAKAAMKTATDKTVPYMLHGRMVYTSSAAASYETCRNAWKDAVTILRERESA